MASTWYRAGTITVTNGSQAVVGSGTQFVTSNIRIGDALHAPDGRVYEVIEVQSATQITISPAYIGGTSTGQSYAIQPTRGIIQSLYNSVSGLTGSVEGYLGGVLAGLFPDGAVDAPAVSFGSQPDQGRYINGDGNMADVRGSEEYLEYTASGVVVKKPITGAAVQASPDDTTTGRLMRADFGYGPGNLIGTVSQTGSVPDGAALGIPITNANGTYIKFANGLMICMISKSLGSILATGAGTFADAYATAATNLDWPHSFLFGDPPPVIGVNGYVPTASIANSERLCSVTVRSVDRNVLRQCQVIRLSGDSTDQDASIDVIGIGRWFDFS